MALFAGSVFVGFMIIYSAYCAVQIVRKWDLASGSELQLALERKTYLISSLLAYGFGFELLAFFLYIFTADQLHGFFVGAMCAAGSLYVNFYGYPTLIVRLVSFLLAGIWLILNYVDNRAHDYPLTRKKYSLLLVLVPLVLMETVLQAKYFMGLEPNIITSCCGTLFSMDTYALPAGIGGLPTIALKIAFYATVLLTVGSGIFYFVKNRGGYLFSGMTALALVVSVLSVFSFISSYIYELPTHHCPFCMLQKEYGYIGYLVYTTLLGGAVTGLSVGVLMPFRRIDSLREILPSVQRKLALTASSLFLVFAATVTVRIVLSKLVLGGY